MKNNDIKIATKMVMSMNEIDAAVELVVSQLTEITILKT